MVRKYPADEECRECNAASEWVKAVESDIRFKDNREQQIRIYWGLTEQALCDALELMDLEKIANVSESSLLVKNGQLSKSYGSSFSI